MNSFKDYNNTNLVLQLVRSHLKERAHEARRPRPALQPQDGGRGGGGGAVGCVGVCCGVFD